MAIHMHERLKCAISALPVDENAWVAPQFLQLLVIHFRFLILRCIAHAIAPPYHGNGSSPISITREGNCRGDYSEPMPSAVATNCSVKRTSRSQYAQSWPPGCSR